MNQNNNLNQILNFYKGRLYETENIGTLIYTDWDKYKAGVITAEDFKSVTGEQFPVGAITFYSKYGIEDIKAKDTITAKLNNTSVKDDSYYDEEFQYYGTDKNFPKVVRNRKEAPAYGITEDVQDNFASYMDTNYLLGRISKVHELLESDLKPVEREVVQKVFNNLLEYVHNPSNHKIHIAYLFDKDNPETEGKYWLVTKKAYTVDEILNQSDKLYDVNVWKGGLLKDGMSFLNGFGSEQKIKKYLEDTPKSIDFIEQPWFRDGNNFLPYIWNYKKLLSQILTAKQKDAQEHYDSCTKLGTLTNAQLFDKTDAMLQEYKSALQSDGKTL